MLYFLDANVLIDGNRDYYPIARVPEFWSWLVHVGDQSLVKIPLEVYEEIKIGTDDLAMWARGHAVESALLFDEEADVATVSRVTEEGYAANLTDIEIEKIGRDPFLIAYGLIAVGNRCVVTTESSKPNAQRANRRIPDVCGQFGVPCCNTFAFLRALNFTTNWRTSI